MESGESEVPEVRPKNLRGSKRWFGRRRRAIRNIHAHLVRCLELAGSQYFKMVGVIRRLNRLTEVSYPEFFGLRPIG